jgi:hypothetical protein
VSFTVLASGAAAGADFGDASIVRVGDRAEIATAARDARTEYILLAEGEIAPLRGALNGVAAALRDAALVGGRSVRLHEDHYGWMLAPARFGPLPFEPVPIVTPGGERGAADLVRGEIDAPTPGFVAVHRDLLLDPLPDDSLAAMIELGARARERGSRALCRPSMAFVAPALDADDRGSAAALVALAASRPRLRGEHRDVAAVRRRGIARETRLAGGGRTFVRRPLPPVTILTHGARASVAAVRALTPAFARHTHLGDPVAGLRRELERRGDRYTLVVDGARVPSQETFDALVEQLEAAEHIAAVAPDAASLRGSCVLLALARIPQHIEAAGDALDSALASLYSALRGAGRAVLASDLPPVLDAAAAPGACEAIFLAGSKPEITRTTLDALLAAVPDGRVVAVASTTARTRRTVLDAYPIIETVEDGTDPLLAAGLNAALGAVRSELVLVCSDDVLLPGGSVARLRAAFARIPALGAAFPRVNGAGAAEELHEVTYRSVDEMKQFAERRAETYQRDTERIDDAATPAFVASVDALRAVGGIDEKLGPTRWGIADLVLRLRAAGYEVVRCEDVYAHRFPVQESANATASPRAELEREFRARWAFPQIGAVDDGAREAAIAAGFDPSRRVPFRDRASLIVATSQVRAVVALPIAGDRELEHAERFLRAAIAQLDSADPVEIVVLLDGDVAIGDVAARVRALLAADPRPLERTANVRVERVDVERWSPPPQARVVVVAGHEREALSSAERVDASGLSALKEKVS